MAASSLVPNFDPSGWGWMGGGQGGQEQGQGRAADKDGRGKNNDGFQTRMSGTRMRTGSRQ